MSLPRSEGSFVSTASLYVEGGDLGSSAGHDLFGNGHDKQTKRPLVLRVLLSISFIALLVSAYAAISPALTIWVISARGLTHLQKEAMNDAIEMTCINTESPMKANIENVETQMRSIVAYINAMIAERHDIVTDYVPIDVALDEVAPLYTLLNSYGGFFQVVGISAPDGSMIVSVEDTFGWPFQLIQFGFDENATAWFVPYVVEWYDVYWPGAFPVPPGMLLPHATLSDEQWNSLTPGCLLWSPIEIPDTVPDLTASLNAPILLPGSSNITALFSAGISAVNFLSIFGQEDQPGILCTFIQNQNSWIISSSCENISYADLTPQLTSNSSLWEIRDSTRFLSEALARNSTGVVTFDQHNYSVAYLTIQTESGFTAITTVIADSSYFQKTYREVKSNLQKFIIVSLCIAVSLAGILSVFTLGGQLQVINRIKRISEVSLGEGTQPEDNKNQDESERKQKKRWHLGGDISKVNIFSRLSEIRLILDKLEWLEGKVQIVVAFVPVISRLVCRQRLSDSAILESSLLRRMGSYLFCDVANFTGLCESVSPDSAAKLLELFYDTVERAAKANKHNLLVKRLGDGIFIAWGFQLEVEKQKTSSTPLPALAYAAALRIAESVALQAEEFRGLVSKDAPEWMLEVRIGLTTGPALHGLLKTSTLINPDVVGAAVNMAARCQGVGKLPEIKELSKRELTTHYSDRLVCTITTDMATYHANTELASHSQPVASITPKTTTTSTPPPPATNGEEKAAASNPKEAMMQHASRVATRNINAYKRYLVEGIPLQGIGNSDLSVTYVTLGNVCQQRIERAKSTH